jgi:hypothetical protein
MLEKIYNATLIVCAFMAVLTFYLAAKGDAPRYFPVVFLALYLSPVWSFYIEKAVERLKRRRQSHGR